VNAEAIVHHREMLHASGLKTIDRPHHVRSIQRMNEMGDDCRPLASSNRSSVFHPLDAKRTCDPLWRHVTASVSGIHEPHENRQVLTKPGLDWISPVREREHLAISPGKPRFYFREIGDNRTHLPPLSFGMKGFSMAAGLRYSGGVLMPAEMHRKLFTIDDCYRMAEAGILRPDERVELIRGELIQMSPIGTRHQAAVVAATRFLVRLVGDKALVSPQGTVQLDRLSAPQPDFALLRPRDDCYAHEHPAAPDILLIIEVADTSLEFDTEVKLALYAIVGVREYWVADLRNDRVICYSDPSGDSYRTVREFHRADTLASLLLPDCPIQLDVLLPR
jgi:Uma2 family endonuclease